MHENPNFKQNVVNFSNSKKNFKLIKPMNYLNFINLASRSEFIFTDSGGISEEGPSLKKKIFIAREKTERPELLSSYYVNLVGTNPKNILRNLIYFQNRKLKKNINFNPVGDGKSARRICNILMEKN